MGGTLGVLGRVVVVVGVVGAAGLAQAQSQWTATVLTPQNALFNQRAYGTAGGIQVGEFDGQAAVWSGNTASYLNLGPLSAASSVIYATDGVQHVGLTRASSTSLTRAAMWTGFSSTVVDLTPPGYTASSAYAVQGGQQVGGAFAQGASGTVAALWNGSASSFVNLSGSDRGFATSVFGGRQAGYVLTSTSVSLATMWSSTAESRVELHPSSFVESRVLGMDATQQVGYAVRPGGLNVAGLWSGSAVSFVSLAGPGIDDSRALAVFSGYQVGHASTIAGPGGAAIWRGTAASMELLPLPTGNWGYSEATGVWGDATTLYVTGWAVDRNFNSLSKAFLWTMPIPAPGSIPALVLVGIVATRRRR